MILQFINPLHQPPLLFYRFLHPQLILSIFSLLFKAISLILCIIFRFLFTASVFFVGLLLAEVYDLLLIEGGDGLARSVVSKLLPQDHQPCAVTSLVLCQVGSWTAFSPDVRVDLSLYDLDVGQLGNLFVLPLLQGPYLALDVLALLAVPGQLAELAQLQDLLREGSKPLGVQLLLLLD